MLTRKFAKAYIKEFLNALKSQFAYDPSRVVLFGSVAKGTVHSLSDIDVAIWDKKFIGCRPIDCEPIAHILHQYYLIELHTFADGEDEEENPFIGEILKSGVIIADY